MLITIITVCYNAADCIRRTMESVLGQTYRNIEYIVKDGGSADGTSEIISKYKERFEQNGIQFWHIVKKDSGIYDAMNQATILATGKYINYLNADDIFLNDYVVDDIFGDKEHSEDVLYGDAICEYEFIKGKKEYTLWKGQHQDFKLMPFSHQACFLKTSTVKEYYYDTKYKSAADFHLLLKFFKDGKIFRNVQCIIPICTMSGISNTNIVTSYKETIQIKRNLCMETPTKEDTNFNAWMMEVKQWMIYRMPYGFVGRLMRFQVQRKGKKIYKSIEEIIDQPRYS